ncbi:hypothetical protein BTO30_03775 [Domibacillus antri]|uniref:NAD-dependent epimerase/dehydratase domain-containing protein n=1 Tax=Domibacillus antri TaxID=1714264 RepID=A0A1Q8Q880_9BACI|nr:NAD-dependent epimerase/dehydratase family protein [Domibacillus antri]OLN23554.1 hypothetical protein BTO30_03775 [Domibacillus antri]
MNILITGGYGFIGSFVAERFFKENHSIFIIDNLTAGKKENIYFRHKALIADIEDERCEQFFKAHSFDIVIHCAAQTHVQQSIDEPLRDSSTNLLGLINMLNLSKKYGVKKFVFASSASIYGDNQVLPLKEIEEGRPISLYGLNKMTGETYCRKWEEMYGLSSLIFRFSNVYGPRQHLSRESGIIATFTNRLIENKSLVIHGNGDQTRDFIYVGDVAEAIYRGVISGLSGTYNLSSNSETSINELVDELSAFHNITDIQRIENRPGDIHRSRLDNTKVKADLDWVPKYTLHEGLSKTFEYYKNRPEPLIQQNESRAPSYKIPYLSFVENVVLFLLFLCISSFLAPMVDTVDVWLVYILIAALLFGKTQTVIASFLAIGFYVYVMVSQGREWSSLFIDNSILAAFTIYLLVGFIVSYVVDRRKIELQFMKDELESAQSKYEFLTGIYEDTRQVKEQLQEQILRTEDGIGKIYHATKELDSLEPEALFNGAIHVLERTLKARQFVIYLVNPSGYMRLAAKSADDAFQPGASLKMSPDSLIGRAVSQQKIHYNTSLQADEPLFVSPIVQDGKTVAVIACYDVGFEQLTLSYRNLIDVVSRLITASLARAYDYMKEINTERYVGETNALMPYYFQRILDNKRKAFLELRIPYVKLQVLSEDYSADVLRLIGSLLRTNDYFGFDEEGHLFILLSNVHLKDSQFVIERLDQKGITAVPVEEEVPYVS